MDPQPYVLMPRSPAAVVEDQFIRLFKRCVQCGSEMPVCACEPGQTCSLFSGDCNQCPYTTCVGAPTNTPSTPVGAIAGGVVGGIIILGAIIFLAWWFRRKRHHDDDYPEDEMDPQEYWDGMSEQEKEEQDRYSARIKSRQSTHTVASMAPSSAGRRSNIIPIAYIPGVINRSQSDPNLVPPVPPIPAAASGGSSRASQAEALFFTPGELGRNSTYSGYSVRDSVATSRNSLASTIHYNDAIVNPMPAQAVNLIRPTAVSVKSSKNSPSISRATSPPPEHPPLNTKSSIVGKFAQPRAITVTRKNSNSLRPHGQNTFELDGSDVSSIGTSFKQTSGPGSPSRSNGGSTFDYHSSDDESGQNSRLVELPAAKTPTTPSRNPLFANAAELSTSRASSIPSIPKAIEESMKKAMQIHIAPPPEASPFSDEHESRTP